MPLSAPCKKMKNIRLHEMLAVIVTCVMLLAGCAGTALKEDIVAPTPSYAEPPATTGILAEMAERIAQEHGPEYSGFKALDGSKEALDWRLALIDSAVSSVDIQTYLWFPDNSGRLVLERAVKAAQRGVRVRLIIDDLLTAGLDQAIVGLENQPNLEFRLFISIHTRRCRICSSVGMKRQISPPISRHSSSSGKHADDAEHARSRTFRA